VTYDTIEAAFKKYLETFTIMDSPANFDSFSQGYIAGWNAHEAKREISPLQTQLIQAQTSDGSPKQKPPGLV
jgi:hypothetical protein